MKKHLKKLCFCLAFISVLRFSDRNFCLRIPFSHNLTSVCSTSEISPHSDIPAGPKIES